MERAGLTRDDLLVLLVEECGEVIQAATKCLRFGWPRDMPGYGTNNVVLASEVGDLLAVVEALRLDQRALTLARDGKIEKAEMAKAKFGRDLTS